MLIALFFNTSFCMHEQNKPYVPKINLKSPDTTSYNPSFEPEQKNSNLYIFMTTDSLSAIKREIDDSGYDVIAREWKTFRQNKRISMERIEQKEVHPYNDMIEIRLQMAHINEKIELLKKLREQLKFFYDVHDNNNNKLPNYQKKKRRFKSNGKLVKLNYKQIGRRVKKTKDSTKKEIELLQKLLNSEHSHLNEESRERLIHLIYTLAGGITAYSEILDNKIKNVREQIEALNHQKKQLNLIQAASEEQLKSPRRKLSNA